MVHTKSVSELSTGDLSFLRSLDTQAVYDRMAKVQLGGGKCTIACNFCGKCFKNPKEVTKHLLNECSVAGLRRYGKKGRQSGGSRKSGGGADHFYAELRQYEVLTDDQLQRKVYELCGIMVPGGTPRMTMLKILNEFARIYRKDIKKRELQMYLQRLLQEVIQNRHVLPYQGAQNSDEIAQLAAEVQRLNHLLAECRSKQGECRSGIAFAEVQRGTLEKETGATAGELIKLRGEVRRLNELNERLQSDLKDCQEELTRLKAVRDQAVQDIKQAATTVPKGSKEQGIIARVAAVLGEETGLEEEIAKRRARVANLDEQITKTERTIEEKTRALEALVSEITQKTGERDTLRKEIVDLQGQKASELSAIAAQAEKKSKLDTIVAGLEEKEKRATELQADIERLTQTRQALETNKESKAADLAEINRLRGQLEAVRREKEDAIAGLSELPQLKSENERLNGVVLELRKAQAECEQKLADAERNLNGALANVQAKDKQLAEGQKRLAEIQTLIYWSPENKGKPDIDFMEFPEITTDADGNPVRKNVRVTRPKDAKGRPIGLFQKQIDLETKLRQLEATRGDVEKRINEELIPKINKLEDEKRKWTEEENKSKWKLAELAQQLFDIYQKFEWDPKGKKALDLLRYARGETTEMPEAAVKASISSLLNEFSEYITFKGEQLSGLIKRCNEELERTRGELAKSEEARLKIQGDLDACRRDLVNKADAVDRATSKAASEVRKSQEEAALSIGSLRGSMDSELSRLRDQLSAANSKVEECEAAKAELETKIRKQDALMRAMQAETRKMPEEDPRIKQLEDRVAYLASEVTRENEAAGRAREELEKVKREKEAPKVDPVLEQELADVKGQLAQNRDILRQTKEAETAAVHARDDALAALKKCTEDLPPGKSVKDLLTRIVELEQSLEKKSQSEERLSQQSRASEERRRSIESAESQLRSANAALRTQIETLTADKVAAEQERDALRKKISELNKVVDQLSPEIESLKRRLESTEAERDRLAQESGKIGQLEGSLKSKEQELAAKKAELQEILGEKDALEKDLPTLRSTESDLRAEIKNLKADLEDERKLSGQIDGFRTQLETKEAELAAVKAQLSEKDQEALAGLEARVRELTDQLAKQQDECAGQVSNIKSQEGQAKSRALEEQRNRLTQQWEQTNADLERKYKESERRLREQLAAIEAEAKEAKELAAASKRELESRPSGTVGPTGPISEGIKQGLLTDVFVPSDEGLKRRIGELETQLKTAQDELETLRSGLGKEMSKPNPDQAEIESARSNISDLSSQISMFTDDLENTRRMSQHIESLKDAEPGTLLGDIQKQMRRASDAERELAACKAKLAELEGAQQARKAVVSRVSIASRTSQESSSELEKCQNALREKEDLLRKNQEELAAAKAQADRVPGLEADISALRLKLSESEGKVREAEKKVREAETAKDEAFSGVTKSNAELIQTASDARRERDDARGERDTIKGELDSAQRKITEIKAERDNFENQYKESQADLTKARKERDSAKAEESRLRAELETLRQKQTTTVPSSRIAELEQTVDSLQQQVIDSNAERDRVLEDKETAERQLADAIADAKAKGKEVTQIREELTRIQREHAQALSTTKGDADSELNSLRGELADSKQELAKVRKQLEDLSATKSEIDTERANAVADLTALRPQLEEAKSQRDAALGETGNLREQLRAETEKVAAANSERDSVRRTLEASVAEKEAKILELQNAQTGIIGNLEEVREQLETAKGSMEQLKSDKKAAIAKQKEVELRIADLERINRELEAAKEAERQGRETSEDRARRARDEAQRGVTSSLAGLNQTIRERDDEISALKRNLAEQQAEVRRLGDEESRLSSDLSTARGRIADLETEKTEIRSELDTTKSSVASKLETARREKETAEARVTELEGERNALQSRIDTELNPKIADLGRQLTEKAGLSKQGLESLERAKTEAEAERDALKGQLDTKTTECDKCKEDLRTKKQEVKDLERKLKRQGDSAIDVLKDWIALLRTAVASVTGELNKLKTGYMPFGIPDTKENEDKKVKGERPQEQEEDSQEYEEYRFTIVLNKISDIFSAYNANKLELEVLRRTKKSLESETESLKTQLREARDATRAAEDARSLLAINSGAEIQSLTEERDRQIGIVTARDAEIRQLKEEHSKALAAAKSAASSSEEAFRRTISELQEKISELERERDAAKQRASDCDAALAAGATRISELDTALQAKGAELEGERGNLTQQISSIKSKVDTLEKNLGSISQTLTRIEGVTGKNAMEKAKSAVEQYNSIKGKLEDCQRELAELKTANSGLKSANEKLTGDLASATSRAEEAESKLAQCEGEKSDQKAKLEALQEKERAAAAAREAEARRLSAEQRKAREAEERRVKESCEKDKKELEGLIKSLGNQIAEGDRVAEKKWNILRTQNNRDYMDYGQYKSDINKVIDENTKNPVNCPAGKDTINSRLLRMRGYNNQYNRMAGIIRAAREAIEGLNVKECDEVILRLESIVKGYTADRMSFGTKLSNAIKTRIMDLGSDKLELKKDRLNFLSIVKPKVGSYNESEASKAQSKYQSISRQADDYIKSANALIEHYKKTIEIVRPYLSATGSRPTQVATEAAKKIPGICQQVNAKISEKSKLEREGPGQGITNEDLINDFEDISGTVRVYARINDFQVRSGKESMAIVPREPGSEINECTRNIVFQGNKCPPLRVKDKSGERVVPFKDRTFKDFFSVFMCANNNHIYRGITKEVLRDDPLKCGGDLKPTCTYTENSSRGLRSTILQAFSGYRIATFVYGFSGSGKTFTLFGSGTEMPGVVQLAFKDPVVNENLASLEITSIDELYGQGSYNSGDYPKRMANRKLRIGGGRLEPINYMDNFKKIKGNPEIYPGVKFNDIMEISGSGIKIKTTNPKNIGYAIDFLNEKLTMDRKINGAIKATPNNPESSRGHLFITFRLTSKKGVTGEWIVIDAGGIENPNAIVRTFFPEVTGNLVAVIGSPDSSRLALNVKTNSSSLVGKSGDIYDLIWKNTELGRRAKELLEIYRIKYTSNEAKEFIDKEAYILINQLKYGDDDLTVALHKITEDSIRYRNIEGNARSTEFYKNVIQNKKLDNFANKYGLEKDNVIKDLLVLKARFDKPFRDSVFVPAAKADANKIQPDLGKLQEEYIRYKLKQVLDIIREGFYINESLNEMKAYFKRQQDDWANLPDPQPGMSNEEVRRQTMLKINSEAIQIKPGKSVEKKKRYDEFDWFYLPHFKGEEVDRLYYQTAAKGIGELPFIPFNEKTDPIGMLTKLQQIADLKERKDKPSKFVLIALVRPDLEEKVEEVKISSGKLVTRETYKETNKYCVGTQAALEFAEQIASTRKITEA